MPGRPLGFPVAAFLELHIEQGPLLEAADKMIGLVTGIQGKKTYEITLNGAEGHAGTLPMADRRDALAAFTRIATLLYRDVGGHDEDVKFTIGRLRIEPNAPSVVPAWIVFSIDLRHPANEVLDALGVRLEAICRDEAAPCAIQARRLVDAPSNGFDPGLRNRIAAAAERHGASSMPILSAAGHDARHLAKVCPTAMIFIPCRGGVSHAETEWAEPVHVASGTAILADVLAGLVTDEEPDR
jgi:N-carbamoyl-L-amino-acid hydrolase